MISKQQFKAQMSRMEVLFTRDLSKKALREIWEIFKAKDFPIFEKAVSDIIRNEDRFPSPSVIENYYQLNLPPKEQPLDYDDLRKAAKTQKHKYYLNLIFGLLDGEIDIEDLRVQKCLDEQGPVKVFSHYDKEQRHFVKISREHHSNEFWAFLRERFKVGKKPKDHFPKLRKELGIES